MWLEIGWIKIELSSHRAINDCLHILQFVVGTQVLDNGDVLLGKAFGFAARIVATVVVELGRVHLLLLVQQLVLHQRWHVGWVPHVGKHLA